MSTFSPISLFKESNFSILFKDGLPAIEVMLTTTSIPGFSLEQIEIPRPGITDKRPGSHLTFNDLSVTVNCDEKLEVYKQIHNYLLTASNPHTANYDNTYPIFDGILLLTTNKNNVQHKITFYDCFFKSIGAVQLQSTTTDDHLVTFNMDIGYVYYDFE